MQSPDQNQRAKAVDVARLWMRHADRVYGYILLHSRNIPDADDIFQNVGLAVVEAEHAPQDSSQFLAWTFEVARRRILKFYREAGRTPTLPPELIDRVGTMARRQAELEPDCPRREALLTCLQLLSAQHRQLLASHYAQPDLDVAALAKRFGRTLQGIYSLLYRIRLRLKECVERRLRTESI